VRLPGRPPSTEWVEGITLLARDYPSVYADFSFCGADPEHYECPSGCLGPGAAERLGDRLLFCSDNSRRFLFGERGRGLDSPRWAMLRTIYHAISLGGKNATRSPSVPSFTDSLI